MEKIVGANIYYDKKGNPIYYDFLTKKGYMLRDHNLKDYRMYSNRFIFSFGFGILVEMFLKMPLLAVLSGVIALIVLEILFRKKFLPSLSLVGNFKKEKEESLIVKMAQTDVSKLIAKIICYLLISILLIVNLKMEGYEGLFAIASYLISAITLLIAILNLLALFKKGLAKK